MNLDKTAQTKADKLLSKISDMEQRERRSTLMDYGMLIECTGTAVRAGITEYKVAMTKTLWAELYPYAEDAVKGATFEEVLWDVFKLFKNDLCNGPSGSQSYGEFAVMAKTHVKKVVGENVETFKNGKARTKRVEITVTFMPDENLHPSLIFGLKSKRWL